MGGRGRTQRRDKEFFRLGEPDDLADLIVDPSAMSYGVRCMSARASKKSGEVPSTSSITPAGRGFARHELSAASKMIYRARRMPRLEIRPSGSTPGVFFAQPATGAGGGHTDPYTNHSRNFRLEDPPQFFGQIFLGKNFGNKNRVVSIPEERVLSVVPF
jgi:hypothetical protein